MPVVKMIRVVANEFSGCSEEGVLEFSGAVTVGPDRTIGERATMVVDLDLLLSVASPALLLYLAKEVAEKLKPSLDEETPTLEIEHQSSMESDVPENWCSTMDSVDPPEGYSPPSQTAP